MSEEGQGGQSARSDQARGKSNRRGFRGAGGGRGTSDGVLGTVDQFKPCLLLGNESQQSI